MRKLLALTAISAAVLTVSSQASASVTINIIEVGSDVVATGSGTLDLTGLTDDANSLSAIAGINPNQGFLGLGTGTIERWGGLTGPTSFGPGPFAFFPASNTSGTGFALAPNTPPVGGLFVPAGYAGEEINNTATWLNQSIASLELTPGQYVFTIPNDTITVNISAGVPEPATWAMMLLGFGAVGFAMRRSRLGQLTVRRAA